MRPVLSPTEMAAADKAAIEGGVPSLSLMESAGYQVARACARLAGGAYGRRFTLVCGKGNNGGDGFVAARYLHRWGGLPVLSLLGDPGGLKGDALANYRLLGPISARGFDPADLERELGRSSVAVDAIVGTGFRGSLAGPAAEAVELLNRGGTPVVAVDIPSGVEGETGRCDGPCASARMTVTMAALKPGLVLTPGSERAGEVVVADIGIAPGLLRARMGLAGSRDAAGVLPERSASSHKRSVGTVMIVAGSVGMSGAAALAGQGALRAGAGLVTMAVPSSVALFVDQKVTEATTLPLAETPRGTIEASAVEAVLERAKRSSAVALGPGLSTDPETVDFVRKLVPHLDRPLVVDADGLNALAGHTGLLAERSPPTVVTPHPGELARLVGSAAAEINGNRARAAREAARMLGSVVLLKGRGTVVAEPGGYVVVIDSGGPALSSGGTGDVLTGVASAFLASGMDPFQAAWAAAWVHGRAGDLLGGVRGVRGTLAGDLPDAVAEVLRELES